MSVIVPARDEERGIGEAVRSLRALEWDDLEVVVVDDQSRDGTLAAARAAAGDDPRVTVVAGAPLPDGWVGKSWACWQGVQRATGDWLLFTDADVVHAPDSLGRTMAMARRLGRGGLTMFPTIVCEGVAERVVTPAALVAIGTFVAPGPLARKDDSRVAIAAGGYILVKRRLYDAVGRPPRHPHPDGGRRVPGGRGEALRRAARAGARRPAGAAAHVPRRPRGLGRVEQERVVRRRRPAGEGAGERRRDRGRGARRRPWRPRPGCAPRDRRARRDRPGRRSRRWPPCSGCRRGRCRRRRATRPTLPLGMVVLAGATARGALERLIGLGPKWRGRRYPLAR